MNFNQVPAYRALVQACREHPDSQSLTGLFRKVDVAITKRRLYECDSSLNIAGEETNLRRKLNQVQQLEQEALSALLQWHNSHRAIDGVKREVSVPDGGDDN